jgi:signal transduction histidine kinase
MVLVDEAARHDAPPQIQIFASDLHARSLERAREGFYPGDIETDVSEERLRRFFHRENGGYRIRKELRDLVVFAPHNILADPPFSRQDLISCRNLLIYLERDVQRDVIELFHYALNSEGTLLLGSAESIDAADLFRVEDKKLCLFLKRNVPPREPRLPVFPLTWSRIPGESPARPEYPTEPVGYGRLHQQMVEQYAPPSILISPDNKLIHLSDHAGRYLVHPGGEPTASVLKLVRQELRIELQASLQTARDKKQAFDSQPIPVRFNGHSRPVVIHVRPALEPAREGFALVIFEEREPQDDLEAPLASIASSESEAEHLQNLETELALARQRLQAIIEEYETSQEEMKASSEEMQSTNEELRSTMEELETSKEELQSINEELQTVNQQNRHKVEELAQLSSDLQNLLAATDIATLFLDRELRILRFTPKLGDLFNVRVTDRGRPISDLTHRLGYEGLRADAEAVLGRLVPIEREVQDDQDRWYLGRILPYRSTEDRIEGVVITFIDIDTRRRSAEALRASEERLRILNTALLRANADLKHFSYAVSHDMQEPLRMVTGYTQLLARNYRAKLDSQATEYIDNAILGAQRMEALLNDLREYWSVDEQRVEEPAEVDCNAALDRALSHLGSQIKERNAVVSRDLLPSILAEPYALTLLLQNVISNAIKYSRREIAPRIHVSASRNEGEWVFSVQDNGIGIESGDLDKIFAPFKRLHGKEYPGTGLGLAMCQKIVERYGGRIWAESVAGQGSTFRFTLPVIEVRDETGSNRSD